VAVGTYRTQFVATIGPKESLRGAAYAMERDHVGLLVVEEAGRLSGVLSDRSVAFAVVAGKRCAESTTVQDVMTRNTVTVPSGASLHSAIEAMRLHGVRRIPITEGDEHVQGILAADDVLRLLAGELAGLAGVAAEQSRAIPSDDARGSSAACSPHRQAEHYGKHVLVASQDRCVDQVCSEMRARAVGCAIVVDAQGSAVGLVTDRDLVLRVVAAGLEPETTPVSAVMSGPLIAVEPTAPIEEVVETMRAHGVRRIPVLREGRPVGIVTFDDLVVRLGQELQALGAAFAKGQRGEWVAVQIERVREEASEKLGELSAQLGQLGDQALARIGREIESLRERLRRTQSGSSSKGETP